MHRRAYLRGSGVAVAIAGAVGACLSGEDVDLGRNVEAGAPALVDVGVDATIPPGDAGESLLSAAITVTMGTICSGACVDLSATASPTGSYTYSWGQSLGEGEGPKSVCPVATATYSVVVSSASSEEQSTASATVTVVSCDSGAAPGLSDGAPAPASDAGGTQTPAAICVPNPSFEGPTMIGTVGAPGLPATAAPPQWQVCLGHPDVDPAMSLLPASDGMSYVGFAVGSGMFSAVTGSVGTTLCSALEPGTDYAFCIDLGIGVRGVTPPTPVPSLSAPTLQIWGGKTPCSQDELLWTSPPITNADSWAKVCGSFVPSQALPDMSLLPALAGTTGSPGSWSYVIVDHMVAGP
jgi:hypothetical protein